MARARRHRRISAACAFGLLALIAELAGRSLTQRLDVGRHVTTPSYSRTDYYPFLLAVVKIGVALLLARLAWRFAKAHAVGRAARRLHAAVGARRSLPPPRVRLELSPRLWALAFTVTSLIYLVQTDLERISTGRWPLLAPWLHTSALPVFAVLSVLLAVVWRAVARWIGDYEGYALASLARARRLVAAAALAVASWPAQRHDVAPRRRFGLAFESRPPPLLA